MHYEFEHVNKILINSLKWNQMHKISLEEYSNNTQLQLLLGREAGALRASWGKVSYLRRIFNSMCQLKKKMNQMRAKFYLGQNEGYNLWGSIADSSEKLLQRSGGRGQCQGRGILEVEPRFWQKIAASHREQMSPLMILVLF